MFLSPSQLRFVTKEEKKNFGRFVLEPLATGYGYTLGACLRRVLLSSIKGAAITQVKIDKILHQFSTIPGVKEDVLEILLNLKKVRIKLHTSNPVVLRIDARGPREVKAGDFEVPADAEIINKNEHVATLADKKTQFKAELIVEPGFGYSSSEERPTSKVGVLVLDAIFSPVLHVSYKVEQTRVGQAIDLDRLILNITTDGSISPSEAVKQAAAILEEYFSKVTKGEVKAEFPKELELEKAKEDQQLNTKEKAIPVEDLALPLRVINNLKKNKIFVLGDLVKKEHSELLALKNMGAKSVKEIEGLLKKEGWK